MENVEKSMSQLKGKYYKRLSDNGCYSKLISVLYADKLEAKIKWWVDIRLMFLGKPTEIGIY